MELAGVRAGWGEIRRAALTGSRDCAGQVAASRRPRRIRTEIVVNAAGWGAPIAAMVASVPITPWSTSTGDEADRRNELARYAVSARPENLVYMRRGGRRVSHRRLRASPVAWSVGGVPWISRSSSCFRLELFNEILEGAIRRVPVPRRAGASVNAPRASRPTSRPLSAGPRVPGSGRGRALAHRFAPGRDRTSSPIGWSTRAAARRDELNVRRLEPVYEER